MKQGYVSPRTSHWVPYLPPVSDYCSIVHHWELLRCKTRRAGVSPSVLRNGSQSLMDQHLCKWSVRMERGHSPSKSQCRPVTRPNWGNKEGQEDGNRTFVFLALSLNASVGMKSADVREEEIKQMQTGEHVWQCDITGRREPNIFS